MENREGQTKIKKKKVLKTIAAISIILGASMILGATYTSALNIDFNVNLMEILDWFIVSTTGNFNSNADNVLFNDVRFLGKDGNFLSSCDGNAVFFDSNISSGAAKFSVSDLNEAGCNLAAKVGSRAYDINVSYSEYTIPIKALNEKICFSVKFIANGKCKANISDLNILVA